MTISDHDLRGVLVGHDDGWLWQLGSRGCWIVRHKRFLAHASMLDSLDFIGLSNNKCKQTVSISLSRDYSNVVDLKEI